MLCALHLIRNWRQLGPSSKFVGPQNRLPRPHLLKPLGLVVKHLQGFNSESISWSCHSHSLSQITCLSNLNQPQQTCIHKHHFLKRQKRDNVIFFSTMAIWIASQKTEQHPEYQSLRKEQREAMKKVSSSIWKVSLIKKKNKKKHQGDLSNDGNSFCEGVRL